MGIQEAIIGRRLCSGIYIYLWSHLRKVHFVHLWCHPFRPYEFLAIRLGLAGSNLQVPEKQTPR